LALVLSSCVQRAESAAGSGADKKPEAEQTQREAADAGSVQSDIEPAAEPEHDQVRAVLVGHVENARDLGGVALESGGKVAAGVLFRGPPLAGLTADGCAAVSALGIRSVIDLRIESEVSLRPDDACVLAEAQLMPAPLPVPYHVSAADYIAVLDASRSIVRVFEALSDESSYPLYFHCTWGRDRTGILAAVILLALGATPEAVMADYLVSDETVGAYPASLRAAIEEIARRGGIEAYLAAVGVTPQQLSALRARAVVEAR
jgi:hypothetical protein